MPDYPVVDTHTHTYPNRDVGRQAMEDRDYEGPEGTIPELLADMGDLGFVKAVMLNFTPTGDMREAGVQRALGQASPADLGRIEAELRDELAARVQRRNAWTCSVAREHPQLIPFTGLDPLMGEEGMLEELEASVANGARGLKLHLSTQRFPPDTPSLWPVYGRAQDLGLPIVFHSGWFPGKPQHSAFGRPSLFAGMLRTFPRLTVVMAHIGLGWQDEAVALAEEFPNLAFDSSLVVTGSLPPPLSDDETAALLRQAGIERVMFASDWPLCLAEKEKARLEQLPLQEHEKRLLFSENAERILAL